MRALGITCLHLACTMVLLGGTLPAAAQQSSASAEVPSAPTANQLDPGPVTTDARRQVDLPDSPGAVRFGSQAQAKPEDSDAIALWEQTSQTQSESSSAPPAQAPPAQKPVGTAAAEAPNVSAIAASQPAGVAIAPAKQRRVRTIILKTGAIIAAGVAIGVVVALTAATPPKPPGAH